VDVWRIRHGRSDLFSVLKRSDVASIFAVRYDQRRDSDTRQAGEFRENFGDGISIAYCRAAGRSTGRPPNR
jgi:hypothetical protein